MGHRRKTRRTSRLEELADQIVADSRGSTTRLERILLRTARRVVTYRGTLGERVALHFVAACIGLRRLSPRRFADLIGIYLAPLPSTQTPLPHTDGPRADGSDAGPH